VLGPIPGLVAARLRHRAGAAALSVAAVAAAAALVAFVAGIGLVSADATLTRALATTGAERPVVRASHYSHSSRDRATVAATAADALAGLRPFAGPVQRGVLVRQLVDLEAPMVDQIVGVDDPAPWLTLIALGRRLAASRTARAGWRRHFRRPPGRSLRPIASRPAKMRCAWSPSLATTGWPGMTRSVHPAPSACPPPPPPSDGEASTW